MQKLEPPKIQFLMKVYLLIPISRLLPMHPVDIKLPQEDRSSLGKLHEHIYLRDQTTAYPLGLHILRAIDIKMVANRACPCLPVWDSAKKKGFELYCKEEMPIRKMKVEIVNLPLNWSPLFHGKQLIRTSNADDARTFWSQIVWVVSKKASTFGYNGSGIVVHRDVI